MKTIHEANDNHVIAGKGVKMSEREDTFTVMSRYNPWRRLARHMSVNVRAELLLHIDAVADGNRIWLRRGLTQAQRRSALTHELVHAERGPVPQFAEAKEEELVERIAARRLIALDDLAEALVWHGGEVHADTAADCWSDVTMLRARIRACTTRELEYLHRRFEQIEGAARPNTKPKSSSSISSGSGTADRKTPPYTSSSDIHRPATTKC